MLLLTRNEYAQNNYLWEIGFLQITKSRFHG